MISSYTDLSTASVASDYSFRLVCGKSLFMVAINFRGDYTATESPLVI